MIRASFEFDKSILIDAQKHIVNSPKLLQRAMKRREPRLRQITIKIVAVKPGPVKYPIHWTSRRQQRKVMKLLREQNNIPYQRKDDLINSYDAKFKFDADGGTFMVENTSPVAQYVIGDSQQKFHDITGWRKLEDVVDEQVVPLVFDDFEKTFYSVANPFV